MIVMKQRWSHKLRLIWSQVIEILAWQNDTWKTATFYQILHTWIESDMHVHWPRSFICEHVWKDENFMLQFRRAYAANSPDLSIRVVLSTKELTKLVTCPNANCLSDKSSISAIEIKNRQWFALTTSPFAKDPDTENLTLTVRFWDNTWLPCSESTRTWSCRSTWRMMKT